MMQCYCGGKMEFQQGVGKRGTPYAFYGCSNFRKGCRTILQPEEFSALEKQGITQVPKDTQKVREFVRPNFKRYLPKQKSNPNRNAQVQFRRLTDEQESVIAEIIRPGIHRIRVNADAGTGKSTLLKQIASRVPRRREEWTTGIIISFGKRPADEMVPELPGNWAASTVHSAGNDSVAAFYGVDKRNPNEYKTKDILTAEYGAPENPEEIALHSVVEGMVEMCKALVFTEAVDDNDLLDQCNFYNVNIGADPLRACDMVKYVLRIGSSPDGIKKFGHDFGDMIYLPVRNNLAVARYRYVAVDEAQDSSPARMRLALMMCIESLIIVGDDMQSIFGFTYADTESMNNFGQLMGPMTRDFEITVNWRCPAIVLELARILCPSIKARPNAPRGDIHEIEDVDFFRIVRPGDVVLCRVNADLLHAAYEIIKQGIGAVVLGRDIARGLKNIIVKLGRNPDGTYIKTMAFLQRLNKWYAAETELIANKNLRNPEKAYQKLDDDYQCILALCGVEVTEDNVLTGVGIPSIEGVLLKIDQMFGEETDSGYDPARVVTLSTIHKFKGGQAGRIFILRAHENHPHPMAESPWELKQEICVLHVGVTRCGTGTAVPGQALFFVGAMPAMLRDFGGAALISPYAGSMR